MEKLKKKLIKKAASCARDLFAGKKDKDLFFHAFRHTKRVARYADRIATKVSLSKNDYVLLMVTAWLHDLEYLQGPADIKKNRKSLIEEFLLLHHVNSATVLLVMDIVHSTGTPQSSTSMVAHILCDAEHYYFGSRRFFKWTKALRKETQRNRGEKINKVQWLSNTAAIMESHVFFTDYARKKRCKGVRRNLAKLQARQKGADSPTSANQTSGIQVNR